MMITKRFLHVTLVAASLLAVSCKQGAGERCQVNSDCDDGLICIIPAGGALQTGGLCTYPTTNDAGADLSVPQDLEVLDADTTDAL